jgi:histidine triad (HIT) family protein
MANYDPLTPEGTCIFCDFATKKKTAAGLFYETDTHMAFLTPWPNTEGFTVVIPKAHLNSDVLSLPDSDLTDLMLTGKKVSSMLQKAFPDVGRVGMMVEGMGIDHAHIKLIPLHGTDYLKKEWKQMHGKCEGVYHETYKGYLISKEGPKVEDTVLATLAAKLKKYQ